MNEVAGKFRVSRYGRKAVAENLVIEQGARAGCEGRREPRASVYELSITVPSISVTTAEGLPRCTLPIYDTGLYRTLGDLLLPLLPQRLLKAVP